MKKNNVFLVVFAVLSQHVLSICESSCNYRNLQKPCQNTMFFDDFQKCDEHVSCTLRCKFSLFFIQKFYQQITHKMLKNRYKMMSKANVFWKRYFHDLGSIGGPFWEAFGVQDRPRATQEPSRDL